jgi:hypothetical protein
VDTLASWRPGPYHWFPYPKTVGYRKLTIVDIVDRIVFRILAFLAASSTDGALSRRVFGHRLVPGGSWSVWPPPQAWRRFLRHQLSSLKKNEWAYTCVSDVTGYYLAIDTDLMCAAMSAQGIPEMVVAPIERVLHLWQETGELRGLPMGGEASGVLSAGYLLPIDGQLDAVARDYAMYGDDFTVFDGDVGAGRAVLQLVDHHLEKLSLTRNVAKTEEFLDPVEAYNHIQNGKLAYIDAIEDIDDEWAVELIYKVWDEEVLPVAKPDLTEVRFVLGRLAKRKDPYAVPGLLSRVDLLQVDPQRAIGYLAETVAEDQDVAEQLAWHLAMPPTVTTEALHLHVCRFLAAADRSSVVATATERVLDAATEFRGTTRAMAAQARRRCPGWRYDDAIDRADAEREFAVRRSLVATTKGMVDHVPTRRLALSELARRDRALSATVAWALAA